VEPPGSTSEGASSLPTSLKNLGQCSCAKVHKGERVDGGFGPNVELCGAVMLALFRDQSREASVSHECTSIAGYRIQ
jgi:hypothetical protein